MIMTKENAEITDIVDMVRNGRPFHTPMYEQEINFDAGHTPAPHVWNNITEVVIDGKKYTAYS
jgi:hypothetical protein